MQIAPTGLHNVPKGGRNLDGRAVVVHAISVQRSVACNGRAMSVRCRVEIPLRNRTPAVLLLLLGGPVLKAVTYSEFGSPEVLRYRDVDKPEPRRGEVLVHIRAASLNASDRQTLRGTPLIVRLMAGPMKPKQAILGDDIAGVVEAIGDRVTRFAVGDSVFGFSNFGGFAEYRCVPEDRLALKPDSVSFEEAATLPVAGTTALQGLRDKGRIRRGMAVLIVGASGGVGSFAVQIARTYDAQIAALCSGTKMEFVRSLGADTVFDYSSYDVRSSTVRYDLVLAAGGNRKVTDYARALHPGGGFVCVGGTMKQYFRAAMFGPVVSMASNKRLGSMFARPSSDDLAYLAALVADGSIRPAVDRLYPLKETPDAINYLESGEARGKVVVTV